MDTGWIGPTTGGGFVPDARRALGGIIGAVDRLAHETAWECAAARDFRSELAGLRGQLESARRTADGLEDELRGLWHQAQAAVW